MQLCLQQLQAALSGTPRLWCLRVHRKGVDFSVRLERTALDKLRMSDWKVCQMEARVITILDACVLFIFKNPAFPNLYSIQQQEHKAGCWEPLGQDMLWYLCCRSVMYKILKHMYVMCVYTYVSMHVLIHTHIQFSIELSYLSGQMSMFENPKHISQQVLFGTTYWQRTELGKMYMIKSQMS